MPRPRRASVDGPAPEEASRTACGCLAHRANCPYEPYTMPTATEETNRAIEVERSVRKRHLGKFETGLRPALHEALRRLYSLPRLPANPYFFVATALSAYSSHGRKDVWSVTDEEVLDELEDVTLVDGGNGHRSSRFNRHQDPTSKVPRTSVPENQQTARPAEPRVCVSVFAFVARGLSAPA